MHRETILCHFSPELTESAVDPVAFGVGRPFPAASVPCRCFLDCRHADRLACSGPERIRMHVRRLSKSMGRNDIILPAKSFRLKRNCNGSGSCSALPTRKAAQDIASRPACSSGGRLQQGSALPAGRVQHGPQYRMMPGKRNLLP